MYKNLKERRSFGDGKLIQGRWVSTYVWKKDTADASHAGRKRFLAGLWWLMQRRRTNTIRFLTGMLHGSRTLSLGKARISCQLAKMFIVSVFEIDSCEKQKYGFIVFSKSVIVLLNIPIWPCSTYGEQRKEKAKWASTSRCPTIWGGIELGGSVYCKRSVDWSMTTYKNIRVVCSRREAALAHTISNSVENRWMQLNTVKIFDW